MYDTSDRKSSNDVEVWPTYPPLLTIAQTAAILQVDARTVPLLIADHGLPVVVLGPRIRRINKVHLKRWMTLQPRNPPEHGLGPK